MYLRTTARRAKSREVVRYLALAPNERNERGVPVAKVIRNLGREDILDRDALVRLVRSIQRFLGGEEGLAGSSSTTRTSTSRCGCGSLAGAWGSNRARGSTATTSSRSAVTSGGSWSATAGPCSCAAGRGRCSHWRLPCCSPPRRRALTARREGWEADKRRSLAEALRRLPCLLRERRSIQRARRVTPLDFAGWLTPRLLSPYFATCLRTGAIDRLMRGYWAAGLRLFARRQA